MPEMPGEGTAAPLSLRQSARGGFAALARSRTDSGPPHQPHFQVWPMDAPQSGRRDADRHAALWTGRVSRSAPNAGVRKEGGGGGAGPNRAGAQPCPGIVRGQRFLGQEHPRDPDSLPHSGARVRSPGGACGFPADRPAHSLGLLVEEDPAATVVGYAALLASIEKSINGRRTKPVHFEMTLFKKNQDAINALVNHQVDLLKIGGNSYLKAKDRDPRVHLLVSQNPPQQGVIFVRESSELR